jgi:hypothetical protein
VCPATNPTVHPAILQIIFGACARLCRRGFLEVLSASAFFRNPRRLIPRSRNRHSSSGFSANCRNCRQEAFALATDSPIYAALLTLYCAHCLVSLFAKLTLMRFGAPFGVLFFQKSRSQSLATHARLPFLSASCSRLPRHDRKRWVATSGLSSLHGSCSWARGFYTANPSHTPVGFILSKGLPRFARVASPSPNCSKDRERVPLMRFARGNCMQSPRRRFRVLRANEVAFPLSRGAALHKVFRLFTRAAKTHLILAVFRHRSV